MRILFGIVRFFLMFSHISSLFLLTSLWSAKSYAETPLDLEELFTDKGRFKMELGVTYANFNRTELSSGLPLLVQLGPTQFLSLPSQIVEGDRNRDVVIPSLGLRYGLGRNTEIYGRATWILDYVRQTGMDGSLSSERKGFNDLWLGANYKLTDNETSPALVGFIETAAVEQRQNLKVYGKNWTIGSTVYQSIDPVVLSLTTAYGRTFSDMQKGASGGLKSLFLLSPQISFAVNPYVTLSGGLTWRNAQEYRNGLNRVYISRSTTTSVDIGVAYLWGNQSMVTVMSRSDLSGKGGTEVNLGLQIKLGKYI